MACSHHIVGRPVCMLSQEASRTVAATVCGIQILHNTDCAGCGEVVHCLNNHSEDVALNGHVQQRSAAGHCQHDASSRLHQSVTDYSCCSANIHRCVTSIHSLCVCVLKHCGQFCLCSLLSDQHVCQGCFCGTRECTAVWQQPGE